MALYLWQVGYTADSIAAQVKNPVNRLDVVRPIAEKFGGKLVDAWFAFGDYDIVAFVEMPDNETMAAFVLAAISGGHLSASKTTPLMPVNEAVSAMTRAGKVAFPAPE